MSSILPPIPPSPGVGERRKGPKNLPRLPLSAFSPPNTGTSERFPLAPDPSVVHPTKVLDAHFVDVGLSPTGVKVEKKEEKGEEGREEWVKEKLEGVVLSLAGLKNDAEVEAAIERYVSLCSLCLLLRPSFLLALYIS